MKTRKKVSPATNLSLDDVIAGGKATQLEPTSARNKRAGRGRPKSKVEKKTCVFRLPLDVIDAIDTHCKGNKSVFAEEVFREYFSQHKIKI